MRRILLLGKRGSLVLWLENLARACTRLEHAVQVFAINGDRWDSWLRAKWQGREAATAEWMLARFQRTLTRFCPDIVIVAGAFGVPLAYYQILHAIPARPLIAGMVGDRFPPESRVRANYCDQLFFTDTHFLQAASQAGFTAACHYLPLAVDPERFRLGHGARSTELLFVASRTAYRETVVRSLVEPIWVSGTDWRELPSSGSQRVENRKISRWTLIRRYQRHQAVLNIRNEANVEHGLNQRSFEPLACGAAVLHDELDDVPLCFEPGREVLVYRNPEEMNALASRLVREPAFARQIAAAGRRRVLAEHTYIHRVQTILKQCGA